MVLTGGGAYLTGQCIDLFNQGQNCLGVCYSSSVFLIHQWIGFESLSDINFCYSSDIVGIDHSESVPASLGCWTVIYY